MVGIADIIAQSKEFGMFDFYLPFIIMFGIFYAMLVRAKIFGDQFGSEPKSAKVAKMVNLIVSLGASFFIMAYQPQVVTLSTFLATMFGQTFVVILSLISFAMIIYVAGTSFGFKTELGGAGKKTVTAVILIFILIGVAIFFSSGGAAFFPGLSFSQFPSIALPAISLPGLNISANDLAIVFLVVVTGVIIYFIAIKEEGYSVTKEEKEFVEKAKAEAAKRQKREE